MNAEPTSDNHSGKRRLSPTYLVIGALILLVLGYAAGRWAVPASPEGSGAPADEVSNEVTTWTCSMHPEVRLPQFGPCPKCGMDLIPVTQDGEMDSDRPVFTATAATRALMNIQSVPAERRFVTAEVRMVGRVDFDETRLGYITAWVGGRLDRLYVDYTGVEVKQGDHMVYLYSPELLTAQQELRRAVRGVETLSGASETVRSTSVLTLDAARERLRRWGLTDAQIRQAESDSALSDHITIYAPMGGTVIERNGTEGMYVDVGTRIYTIADLSVVWVRLDAYESDLPWLHYGQKVEFSTDAHPGETFEGKIAFIDPLVDQTTRTIKVRVNVSNAGRILKPGMFVRALVRAEVAGDGRVMDPELAGKWISPMHPEIVKDGPGPCDVCGMPLVPAEELGYVSSHREISGLPLVIPVSAPLITGKRAIVYVETPGEDGPAFEGREITLGPRAGDYYFVADGLLEGDLVVTHGNFKIDSAVQILARPSMMQPAEPSGESLSEAIALPAEFEQAMQALIGAYLPLQRRLAEDDPEGARDAGAVVLERLTALEAGELSARAGSAWRDSRLAALAGEAADLAFTGDIDADRETFHAISNALVEAMRAFSVRTDEPVYLAHCPMADDSAGADWLQTGETVDNPYYGALMRTCGDILGRVDAAPRVMPRTSAPAGHVH